MREREGEIKRKQARRRRGNFVYCTKLTLRQTVGGIAKRVDTGVALYYVGIGST